MDRNRSADRSRHRPAIEWVAGALGFLITLALIGFVGWQAFQDNSEPPKVEVRVAGVISNGDTYLVKIVAVNMSSQTVAGLVVDGTLSSRTGQIERSSTTFDYLPGNSRVEGGLFFSSDPAAGELRVRPAGYRLP